MMILGFKAEVTWELHSWETVSSQLSHHSSQNKPQWFPKNPAGTIGLPNLAEGVPGNYSMVHCWKFLKALKNLQADADSWETPGQP